MAIREYYGLIILLVITIAIAIISIVLNAKKKKKSEKLETQMKTMQANSSTTKSDVASSEEIALSNYKHYTYIYIFIKLKKKGYKSIPMNKFIEEFYNALQTFPADSKLRKVFDEIKSSNDIGFDIVNFDITYNLVSKKSFIGKNDQILLEGYFDLDLEELTQLNKTLDADAKALGEKIITLY